jgi:DNA-binding NtrC family response regulator
MTALLGLEGLGLPRLHRLGRLSPQGRLFLVRDLVEGDSLAALLAQGRSVEALQALIRGIPALAAVHRAGRVHGDLKPANFILRPEGDAVLIDLGLSASWRSTAAARGGTSGFVAPELLRGAAPSVASEVFALGKTLQTLVEALPPSPFAPALRRIVAQATDPAPGRRHPSVDELGAALRAALGMLAPLPPRPPCWPVLGLDGVMDDLIRRLSMLPPGGVLELQGRSGAGRSTVLRRLAWTMAAEEAPVGWIEGQARGEALLWALEFEDLRGFVFVDDAAALEPHAWRRLQEARERGARLVLVGGGSGEGRFELPPLGPEQALSLVRGVAPGLPTAVLRWVVERGAGRPGKLRQLAAALAGAAVVSVADAQRVLGLAGASGGPPAPGEGARRALEQGRLVEARALLATEDPGDPDVAWLLARVALAEGDPTRSRGALERLAQAPGRHRALLQARLALLAGDPRGAQALALEALRLDPHPRDGAWSGEELEVEALTCAGLAAALQGLHEEARPSLARALLLARRLGHRRLEGLALSSLGFALQRAGAAEEARGAYEEALEGAVELGDAAAAATLRLNLASLLEQEAPAEALAHLEGALDLGHKVGRMATVRQALLNLAHLDLALGRVASARERIQSLEHHRAGLTGAQQAQLWGLQAMAAARAGEIDEALACYERCASAYEGLQRPEDGREARAEAALVAARAGRGLPGPVPPGALGDLARALAARARGQERSAERWLEAALEQAERQGSAGVRWRALVARGQGALLAGRILAARRDGEAALALLEEQAARLTPELQQVFWSDPERQEARALVLPPSMARTTPGLEERLARILEINRDLASHRETGPLLDRLLDHAASFLGAARACILLLDEGGTLAPRAARGFPSDDAPRAFSRGIAARVLSSGEPVFSSSARDDEHLRGFASVHLLDLRAVACVPIRSPRGGAMGVLYIESPSTSPGPADQDQRLLQAFADQAAIAIEQARLGEENRRRARALELANEELAQAKEHLQELLEQKRAQLESTRRDLKETRAALRGRFGYRGLVGASEPMRRLFALIDRLKDTDVPVLIAGESGTGKEIVARVIHEASARGSQPFVAINCGAIPEQLLESELFGHKKGAFTGADRDRLGLFREAQGGSVLLDEIGEMPARMQASLLRVLQEGVVQPVGGGPEQPIHGRILAATHRDLAAMVQAGTFREDLLYRLRVVELRVPPLRERAEDIPLLVDHFLKMFAARYRRERGTLSRDALQLLAAHPWPGNVRQLQNTLLNAWVLAEHDELQVEDFAALSPPPASAPAPPAPAPRASSSLEDHRGAEKQRILEALERHGWNRLQAALSLHIPRRTFYRRLREYGIL